MTEKELRILVRTGISLINEENARSLDQAKEKKLKKLVLNHLKGGKTIAQAAQLAGVSTSTFYKWSKSDGGFETKSSKLRESENEEELVDEKKKKGLWDNVHAKRKRGEKPAKPGDEDYPDEEAWKDAQESLEEGAFRYGANVWNNQNPRSTGNMHILKDEPMEDIHKMKNDSDEQLEKLKEIGFHLNTRAKEREALEDGRYLLQDWRRKNGMKFDKKLMMSIEAPEEIWSTAHGAMQEYSNLTIPNKKSQDYLEYLKQKAIKNPKKFKKEYLEFTENDFITDIKYNYKEPSLFNVESKLTEARSYNLGTLTDAEYDKIIGDAVRKLDGIKQYDKMASGYGKTASSSDSTRITITQYGKTDNTDALKKILKKADSNLLVNTIENNFDATDNERSGNDKSKDIWKYTIKKDINYNEADKLGLLVFGDGNVTDMDHDIVVSLMDMMAAYTSDATPLADIQWRTLKDFMKAASDYIKGSAWKKFQKDVEKR